MKEKEEGSGNKNEDIEIERIKAKKMREMEARMKSKKDGKKGEQLIDHPLTLDDSSFIPTVRKYPLVVVDCWAPWCAPCRMVAPIIDELAREYAGKVVFGKLNVDENPRIASEFAIMAIPTMFIVKNGEPVDVIQGALPKPYLEAKLREWI